MRRTPGHGAPHRRGPPPVGARAVGDRVVYSIYSTDPNRNSYPVRRVSSAGAFRLHNGQQFLSQALNDEMIGLEEIDDGIWNVLYYQTLLGRFDERTRTITGAPSLKMDC